MTYDAKYLGWLKVTTKKDELLLREGPSVESEILCAMPKDSYVYGYGAVENGYAFVEYPDPETLSLIRGMASSTYLGEVNE